MFVNKQILLECGICDEGRAEFDRLSCGDPDFQMDYDLALQYVRKTHELFPDHGTWVTSIETLVNKRRFFEIQGIELEMKNTYQVFDYRTGKYTTFSNLEDALKERTNLIQEFVKLHFDSFQIVQEANVPELNQSTWIRLTQSDIANSNFETTINII